MMYFVVFGAVPMLLVFHLCPVCVSVFFLLFIFVSLTGFAGFVDVVFVIHFDRLIFFPMDTLGSNNLGGDERDDVSRFKLPADFSFSGFLGFFFWRRFSSSFFPHSKWCWCLCRWLEVGAY